MMQRQIAQLTRMVNDLLDVSRVTHGKITLRLEPTDLARVVARAIETATPALEAKRLRLTHELAPGPLMVRGDAARLLQVFSNLLDNAAKFTAFRRRGGRDARARGHASARRGERQRRRHRSAFLPTMFEAFTQADTSLERSHERPRPSGLALARQIVEAHGGIDLGHERRTRPGAAALRPASASCLEVVQERAGLVELVAGALRLGEHRVARVAPLRVLEEERCLHVRREALVRLGQAAEQAGERV
jgi:K+-sensing histidine kinase KdpD